MKLLYAPILYRFDKGLWPPTIVDAEYFRWQSDLLAFFDISKVDVIWSGPHRNSVFKDPIPLMIEELEIKNVKYKVGKIQKLAKKVDWILVDHPSSVMLDAERMGKQCICINPSRIDYQFIRSDVKNLKYRNIFYRDRTADALAIIEALIIDSKLKVDLSYLKKNKTNWMEWIEECSEIVRL